ncbi:MAG: DUF2357 domain-containing protein [Chloroflexi bacterium AL-W]|nr:DUF2357 domain-containing protein [Chloroflexi bacterium AL-N1]NOK65382.1 DUF2357 domain-containing protein [Chloroflexi bacterium AL-N10]NOK72352.1 DUF2357 domain-containing protein [Chloroflexi bacterium AL-N5]NOK79561.1 DUF2357 domain-containing protein [Chloroflexi bacterium AL-W]NOK87477.1 DUF2357 domain-containing protein [Chloroflexi bacterium AL-N15]
MTEILLTLDDKNDLPRITEHQSIEFACIPPAHSWLTLNVGSQSLEPFVRPGEHVWRWHWNPGTAVGLHRVVLAVGKTNDDRHQHTWTLPVAPRKIDQERYEALFEDIQHSTYNIIYTLAGASEEGATLHRDAPWQRSLLEEYYAFFEERLDTFVRAVRRIAKRPQEHLHTATDEVTLDQVTTLDAEAVQRMTRGAFDEVPKHIAPDLQQQLRPGGGLLPRNLTTPHHTPTFDCYEHRLLKRLLTLLLRRARFIGLRAEREVKRLARNEALSGTTSFARVQQIADGCTAATRQLRELRDQPFLADVGALTMFRGATPLLQRDPAYREIYRMWQVQRQHPFVAFDSPLFSIPITDLPHLYEAWCTIQVAQAVIALGGEVQTQHLVTPPGDDADNITYAVTLTEQTPMLVMQYGARTLTLRYQPRYRPHRANTANQLGSLDRHTRVPDIAIEVTQPDYPTHVLILDAKYRLDASGHSVPQDALADAYTYLGAIGCNGKRSTIGALLLYPGSGKPELYASGVGAIPLVPGHIDSLTSVLEKILGNFEA